jgi:hypothetical protein
LVELAAGTVITITVGAPGTGGAANGGTGAAGGTTTISGPGITTLNSGGGAGGVGTTTTNGIGGAASGGNLLNVNGQAGAGQNGGGIAALDVVPQNITGPSTTELLAGRVLLPATRGNLFSGGSAGVAASFGGGGFGGVFSSFNNGYEFVYYANPGNSGGTGFVVLEWFIS